MVLLSFVSMASILRLYDYSLTPQLFRRETVAKVNSLTILLARLFRLCRKDEAQGAEGEV